MRILVTGGAGYIGSHTCVVLLEAGHEVAILDNLDNSHIEVLGRLRQVSKRTPVFFKADVRDRVAVEAAFDSFCPEAVIHFAGLKAVGESVRNPLRYYECNVSGSVVLLRIMQERNVRIMVFSSSATVYGVPSEVPIREDAVIAPTNPYGHSKAMVEQILADLASSESGWRVASLRYFNPVGAHESGLIGESPKGAPNNLMPSISQVAAGAAEKLTVFGNDYATSDGTGVRDYIHVMDLASGHLAALHYLNRNEGMLTANLGTGHGYSVLEIVSAFEEISGKHVPYQVANRRPGDVAQCFADPAQALRLLGWQARFGLEEMCRDTWRWQSMNPRGYGTEP